MDRAKQAQELRPSVSGGSAVSDALPRRQMIAHVLAAGSGFLALLCIGLAGVSPKASADSVDRRVFELSIASRKLSVGEPVVRVTEGDSVELRWTGDEQVSLHLHGYDIEVRVVPGKSASMFLEAIATGRFPITSHGFGASPEGHGHPTIAYLEVHPR